MSAGYLRISLEQAELLAEYLHAQANSVCLPSGAGE